MDDARLYLCARCHCQVVVCSRCDYGQLYCGTGCSEAARRANVRAAGQRYQRTPRGRHCHAERQRRYRGRLQNRATQEEVTHQGSERALGAETLAPQEQPPAKEPPVTSASLRLGPSSRRIGPSALRQDPHCHFCARPVSGFVRLGWLRTRTRPSLSTWPWT